MEKLKDILWPIVLVGGFGAFIDFMIGRTGQEKAKDFLFRWWVRFDDVRWSNFGREEGLFAGQLIEKWFGRRIWSFRRIGSTMLLFLLFMLIGYIIRPPSSYVVNTNGFIFCLICDYKGFWDIGDIAAITIISSVCAFLISISFTKYITFRMAYFCRVGGLNNILIFILMLITNYLIFTLWLPMTENVKWVAAFALHEARFIPDENITTLMKTLLHNVILQAVRGIHEITLYPKFFVNVLFAERNPIDEFSAYMLTTFPSLMRFAISIVFIGSFLLKRLVMRPVNLVWRRIVESDKQVFTLIFGGAAALATAISEAAKHL
jgi:hypothetical protein